MSVKRSAIHRLTPTAPSGTYALESPFAIVRMSGTTPGTGARDFERVLVRIAAAVCEKEDVDVAGRDLGEPGAEARARLGGRRRARVRQDGDLILDGLDDARIRVPDVDAHQLAVEVDEALAVRRPQVDAPRARHRNRVDRALRRPL